MSAQKLLVEFHIIFVIIFLTVLTNQQIEWGNWEGYRKKNSSLCTLNILEGDKRTLRSLIFTINKQASNETLVHRLTNHVEQESRTGIMHQRINNLRIRDQTSSFQHIQLPQRRKRTPGCLVLLHWVTHCSLSQSWSVMNKEANTMRDGEKERSERWLGNGVNVKRHWVHSFNITT